MQLSCNSKHFSLHERVLSETLLVLPELEPAASPWWAHCTATFELTAWSYSFMRLIKSLWPLLATGFESDSRLLYNLLSLRRQRLIFSVNYGDCELEVAAIHSRFETLLRHGTTRNCTEALHTMGWYPRLKRQT